MATEGDGTISSVGFVPAGGKKNAPVFKHKKSGLVCSVTSKAAGNFIRHFLYTKGHQTCSCQTVYRNGRGQDLVDTGATLSWNPPVTFTPSGYDVYLGTVEADVAAGSAGVRVAQGQPGTSYTDGALLPGTPYYWRVDAIDPNDGATAVTVEGHVLDFLTMPATPLIETGPESITVADGTPAIPEITGLNFLDFQWWFSTDASNATTGDDSMVGTNSATLSITAELATEGWYYCVATNPAGEDTSPVARIMTERLVGLWKLDGDLTDSVAGKAKLFVDGKRYSGNEVDWNPAAMTLHDEPLIFGSEVTDGTTAPSDGLLDDVRIYSYALDGVTVAQMYIAQYPGTTICIDDIAKSAGDLDGNCEVDLVDLAMMAGDWLNCLIVPNCIQ